MPDKRCRIPGATRVDRTCGTVPDTKILEALSGLRTNRFTGSTGDRGGSGLKGYPETRLANSSQCAQDQYSQEL